MKYDVIIVGAGPAGIFTAMELVKNNSTKNILLVEKGKAIEDRSCPKSKTKKMRQLQSVQYYDRFFRRGRVFGWKAVFEL